MSDENSLAHSQHTTNSLGSVVSVSPGKFEWIFACEIVAKLDWYRCSRWECVILSPGNTKRVKNNFDANNPNPVHTHSGWKKLASIFVEYGKHLCSRRCFCQCLALLCLSLQLLPFSIQAVCVPSKWIHKSPQKYGSVHFNSEIYTNSIR